jgi:hypothetical protein
MSKNIVRHMISILVAIFEEDAGAVPAGVMDCIIEQFSKYAEVSGLAHRVYEGR